MVVDPEKVEELPIEDEVVRHVGRGPRSAVVFPGKEEIVFFLS